VVLNTLVARLVARRKTRFEGVSQTATRQIAHKTAVKRSGGSEETPAGKEAARDRVRVDVN